MRRSSVGSSPRARGTVANPEGVSRSARFIPARAGNGKHNLRPSGMKTVHPRARGERIRLAFEYMAAVGSSPRARGTADKLGLPETVDRFIPARAGNGQPARSRRF